MSNAHVMMPPLYTEEEVRMLSPLELAYIGDTAYEILVRVDCLKKGGTVASLHKRAVTMVNATAQAEAVTRILPTLTKNEEDIFKRGRNAHPKHKSPKGATTAQYTWSTGFEALIGYLYLQGDYARIDELFSLIQTEPTTK